LIVPQQVTLQPPATPGGPVIVTTMPVGVPTTGRELRALRDKRAEISGQLVSAQNRRKELAEQLATSDPGARAGIQARMKVLDDRLVRLEQELDRTGELLMNVPPEVLAGSDVPQVWEKIGPNIVPMTGIIGSLVFFPIALAFARLLWKRASAPSRPAIDEGAHQRLEQLQQAVDAIAIEVERISEGQRYVTRTLSEKSEVR